MCDRRGRFVGATTSSSSSFESEPRDLELEMNFLFRLMFSCVVHQLFKMSSVVAPLCRKSSRRLLNCCKVFSFPLANNTAKCFFPFSNKKYSDRCKHKPQHGQDNLPAVN